MKRNATYFKWTNQTGFATYLICLVLCQPTHIFSDIFAFDKHTPETTLLYIHVSFTLINKLNKLSSK